MNKLVRDLMHKGLITCPPDTSLGQVSVLLAEHHVHSLIVVDQNHNPAGLISDFDLLAGEWLSVDSESLAAMKKLTAGELMSSPLDTIDANVPLQKAAQVMLKQQIHRLVVTENNVPIGVLSISDFVASLASQGRLNRNNVGDVMSDAFLVCRDKTTVFSAARTITQAGWRSVVVVNARGKPLGVVSGIDLLQLAGKDVDESLTVSDVMNSTLLTVDMNASLQDAANLMIQNHRHRVIVVDTNDPESFPLGVISTVDIVAEMARPESIWQRK